MTLERIVVVAHGILVASLVYRWMRRGPALLGAGLPRRDVVLLRRLAHWAFAPAVLVLREGMRVALLLAVGVAPTGFEYLVFHAWVEGTDQVASPVLAVALHLLPNVVVIGAALGLLRWVARHPGTASRNHLLLELGRFVLWIAVFVYPVVSILVREYDFFALRGRLEAILPHLGDAFLVAWGAFAVWLVRLERGVFRRSWRFLATPLRDLVAGAEDRLAANPEDPVALRELGRAYLVGEAPERALPLLHRSAAADPSAPETRFLLGATHLRLGAPREASAELRTAGRILEDLPAPSEELIHEVTLGLAAARLALGDPEGALLTAEEASSRRPLDPRGLLLTVDALLASGRLGDAEHRLARAVDRVDGPQGRVLEDRLAALRKTIRQREDDRRR